MKWPAASFALLFFALFAGACSGGPDASPKPRGYFRISFPEKKYQDYKGGCPFSFRYPAYAVIAQDSNRNARPCWLNMDLPQFSGSVHLSFYPVTSKKIFNELVEDAHTFVFKHTVKATAIDEANIAYPQKKVYGIYYTINGNAASSVQFFLTDSTKHYLRGALYFNEEPRLDSIQPVLDFVKQDIDTMIHSFRWK
ncbi:MAG: gliding motility lipoprotein GldD [Mucilaginibacter polytrichastri]|nr:gliding motility lipoprotein GldD [Mucilaginibacter polytrichastri]